MRLSMRILPLCLLVIPLEARVPITQRSDYQGSHQDVVFAQRERVRLLTRQAQLDVSSRLGLFQFREGFTWPMEIRFEDGAPGGLENALAYVRLSRTSTGFAQELVVNVTLMASAGDEFDQVFTHEMTHAVLNDAVGGDAAQRIPPWVQEGLAQWVSGEGMDRVKRAAGQYRKSRVVAGLACDLEGPYTAHAYPQYFLAIDALRDRHSVNAIEALVRLLIQGKSIREAVEDSTGTSWEQFQKDVQEHSAKILVEFARPDLE